MMLSSLILCSKSGYPDATSDLFMLALAFSWAMVLRSCSMDFVISKEKSVVDSFEFTVCSVQPWSSSVAPIFIANCFKELRRI